MQKELENEIRRSRSYAPTPGTIWPVRVQRGNQQKSLHSTSGKNMEDMEMDLVEGNQDEDQDMDEDEEYLEEDDEEDGEEDNNEEVSDDAVGQPPGVALANSLVLHTKEMMDEHQPSTQRQYSQHWKGYKVSNGIALSQFQLVYLGAGSDAAWMYLSLVALLRRVLW
jgi:hypothetical protein